MKAKRKVKEDRNLYDQIRAAEDHRYVLSDFGQIIEQARLDKKLSRKYVAEVVGCHPGTIFHLERARRAFLPRRHIFLGVASAIGLSSREMLEAAGYLEPGLKILKKK